MLLFWKLGGAENFCESHTENLTTLENSIRVSKVSRLRFEAQAGIKCQVHRRVTTIK